MDWLRCPHCSTFLPAQNYAGDAWCGCPGCGKWFRPGGEPAVPAAHPVGVPADEPAPPDPNADASLYPPGPREVPEGLTDPGPRYQLQVVAVLGSLLLFFAIYVGLLAGSACLAAVALGAFGVCGLPVALGALLVFLYLVKGLFKSEREGKWARVEVTEAEQPRLFAFIRRVCEDVGAPVPRRVVLNHEVNAAAFYEKSIFALVRPVPKNLHLGLGLVNFLNLTEFKALLAHEFGHFSQRSMKLGQYVYVANRAMGEIAFGRDWLDDLVERLRYQPGLAGLAGQACWAVAYSLRQTMKGMFYGVNFLSLALSRAKEFQADLVAVSVCGSEAPVRTLARGDVAGQALARAADSLRVAADHGLYTRDLFAHQRDALDDLRREKDDAHFGEPPEPADDPMLSVELFDPKDEEEPSIWSTHPTHSQREQNAKRRYVRCRMDDRPAWLLLDDPEELLAKVTWRFYRVELKAPRDAVLDEPEVVRGFLEEERRAATYDPRYLGIYDGRFILPGATARVAALAGDVPPPDALRARHAGLYAGNLPALADRHRRHREERRRLLEYRRQAGGGKVRDLEFRGRRYGPDDVPQLLRFMDEQLEQDQRRLEDVDREVLLVHYYMSQQLGPTAWRSLRERYEFHLALQRILCDLLGLEDQLGSTLAYLNNRPEGPLPAALFERVFSTFRDVRAGLAEALEAAGRLRLPPLWHLKAGAPLGPYLYDRRLVGQFRWSGSISGKKVGKLCQQFGAVIDRARRLHFKSLGGILALQEEIARQWQARFAAGRSGGVPAAADRGE